MIGFTTSGMTSPAYGWKRNRQSSSLFRDKIFIVQCRSLDNTSRHSYWLKDGVWGNFPVLPTVKIISSSLVITSSGGNL